MIHESAYGWLWAISFLLLFIGTGSVRTGLRFNWATPIIGFVRFIFLAQVISVMTGITLLQATRFSLLILIFLGIWNMRNYPLTLFLELFKYFVILGSSTSVITLILSKSGSPFGTYNFDFIYGVQDGLYLSDNSVVIPPSQGGGFPFDWGSVGIGRYCGIFLVTLLNSLINSPLLAGEIIYILSISLVFMSLIYFSTNVLNFKPLKSSVIAIALTVSPLNLLGFHNQLIGQTSGLPVTILLLALLINKNQWVNFASRGFQVEVGILVAGLFWIYPAHLLLLAPLFSIYIIFILIESRKNGSAASIRNGLLIVVGLLILSITRDLIGTLFRIKSLVFYSSSSDTSDDGGILYNSIFNQFSSWRGPIISSGFRVYGDSSLTWPLVLVYVILLWVLLIFLLVRILQRKASFKNPDSVGMMVLFVLYVLICYLVLFLTQSNYLLFKIATWFTPLITLIILYFIQDIFPKFSKLNSKMLLTLFAPGIILTIFTSYVLTARAMEGTDIPFTNSRFAFDDGLRERISSNKNRILVGMPSMEEAAWITLNVPDKEVRQRIDFFGFDQQSLYLGFNRRPPTLPEMYPTDTVYLPRFDLDIFPNNRLLKPPVWENKDVLETKVKFIDKSFVFGVGAFYPDRPENSPFEENKPFRWSNGYLSFGIYSAENDSLSLEFPAILGPDYAAPLKPSVNNGRIQVSGSADEILKFVWEGIELSQGWNVLIFQINSTEIKVVEKNSLRPDFRPLTIAVGKIEILPK